MSLDARIYDKDGTAVAVISDVVDMRHTEQRNEIGEGSVTVAIDNAAAASMSLWRYIRVRNDATELFTYEIHSRVIEYAQESEHAGQLLTASGPGAAVTLGIADIGGGVVYPEGGVDGLTSGLRYMGWMSCDCYDHATNFVDTPAMRHRQDNPVAPWTEEEPTNWPSGSANRIWFDTPTATVAGANEVQTIALGDSISSGTFTLIFEGETTSPVSSPWSAANVKTALEGLSTIDGVTVTGAGTNASPYNITFDGANVAGRDVPLISVDHSSLIHTPSEDTVTEVTKGAKGTYANDPGCIYTYDTFTLANDQSLVLFVNLSETGEIYIDGVQVYKQTAASGAASTQSITVDLPAGTHCITGKACKEATAGLGWIMYTLALAQRDEDGGYDVTSIVVQTSSSTLTLETTFTATPPGLTIGAIMDCLMTEAQALTPSDLDDITWAFTPTLDSDGTSWVDEFVIGFSIGTGLLDVLQRLTDLDTDVSWRMENDLELSIWQTKGTDLTATVAFDNPPAQEILLSSYERIAPSANTVLIETQDGLAEAQDATGVATYGSRRIGMTVGGAITSEGLADFVSDTLDDIADEHLMLTLATHGPSGLEPYTDFTVGDWITAPDEAGTPASFRVLQIQSQMDEHGDPIWTLLLIQEAPPA